MKTSFLGELWRVMGLLGKGKRRYLLALVICAVVDPVYRITFALVNKRLLNSIEFQDFNLMYTSLTMLTAVLAFHFILQPVTAYNYEGRLYYPILDFKLRLVTRISRISLAWLESRHSGDLMTTVAQDVDELDDFYRLYTYDLLSSMIWGAGSVVSMFWINPYMAVIMIVLGLITAWGSTAFSQRLTRQTQAEREGASRVNQKLSDIIPGLRVIKSFTQEKRFAQGYAGVNAEWTAHSAAVSRTNALRSSVSFFLSQLSFLGGLVAAAYMVAQGFLDFGSALAVILLQNGVSAMFTRTGAYYARIKASMVSVRRIMEILDQPDEQQFCFESPAMPERSGAAVSFQEVSFSYPNGKAALDRQCLSATRGAITGLAGPSGGGKSTLAKLLLGLYRPQGGRIFLNGADISTCSLHELRDQIAYVPQDVYLFSDTVAENIRLGRPHADDADIIAAAKSALAHDFIMELPQGYQTRIGQGGAGLSGGQRQRIGIARAILKDAPILLLDEATSALDSAVEQDLLRALAPLVKGKTVLTIAHRESALAWADSVHTLEPAE